MLTTHLSSEILFAFEAGQLSFPECLEVECHLRECTQCARCLDPKNDYQQWLLEESGHPDFERELAPFAYGELTGLAQEYVANHLQDCLLCNEEITLLKQESVYLQCIAPRFNVEINAIKPNINIVQRWGQGWRNWWESVSFASRLRTATALVGLALVTGIGHFYLNLLSETVTPLRASLPQLSTTLKQLILLPALPLVSPTPSHSAGSSPAQKPNPELTAKLHQAQTKPIKRDEWDKLPAQLRRETESILAGSTPTEVRNLQPQAIILRGPRQAQAEFLSLREPVGKTIATEQPLLTWEALPGATSYTVSVSDSQYNEVANSGPLKTTSFRPSQPLRRGQIYLWRVTAIKGEQTINAPSSPASPAIFRVADNATLRRVKELRGQNQRLPLILFCIRQGLLDEAKIELLEAVRSKPGSRLYQRLLQNVTRWSNSVPGAKRKVKTKS